jgi:hypothetical protein
MDSTCKQNAVRFALVYPLSKPKGNPPVFTPLPDIRNFLEWVGIVEEKEEEEKKSVVPAQARIPFPAERLLKERGLGV